MDQDGKSSLPSLVKAFDSVFDVYEGFCNLKQVRFPAKLFLGSVLFIHGILLVYNCFAFGWLERRKLS